MNIALIGASGRAGSRLTTELLSRGHRVTGIARTPQPSDNRAGLTFVQADATVGSDLLPVLKGHDAVICTMSPGSINVEVLIGAVKAAGVNRLLIVGGAGGLEVVPGKILMDTPEFPELYKKGAAAGVRFLEMLRLENDLDWTLLSPSAFFAPGTRTGAFRLGGDQLLVDGNGKSHISMEDYAIAMVDELERPAHSWRRFTVGY